MSSKSISGLGLRERAKGGWNAKGKDGGKESWRKDFKGVDTVAGWVGKGKDSNEAGQEQHQVAPLSTLRDPVSFGPPPKRVNYTRAAPSASSTGRVHGETETPPADEEVHQPPPYRADTTGLSTANLPKPPAFRPAPAPSTGGPPKLPPRLPPRQSSQQNARVLAPPPPYNSGPREDVPLQGLLNQGAMDRLGKAGISVPGFDIGGRTPSPTIAPRRGDSPINRAPAPPGPKSPQLNELQSRFAKMTTAPRESQGQSTSWGDKKAALKTASSFRDDPTNVSLSDIKGAASTANNFRERHGEQAAEAWRAADGDDGPIQMQDNTQNANSSEAQAVPPYQPSIGYQPRRPPAHRPQDSVGKKPPPPPPKKKELASAYGEPPPIPSASKPKF